MMRVICLANEYLKFNSKIMKYGGGTWGNSALKGKRWDGEGIYNEFWVRPTDDLKPQNYKNVEDGCYWNERMVC